MSSSAKSWGSQWSPSLGQTWPAIPSEMSSKMNRSGTCKPNSRSLMDLAFRRKMGMPSHQMFSTQARSHERKEALAGQTTRAINKHKNIYSIGVYILSLYYLLHLECHVNIKKYKYTWQYYYLGYIGMGIQSSDSHGGRKTMAKRNQTILVQPSNRRPYCRT